MPARTLKTSKKARILDARPDRVDVRDRIYQPPLVSLPPQWPPPERIAKYFQAYRDAGLVLDQGEDGACTGFGLGALINYLLFAQSVITKEPPPTRVSTRMLYHLARKYDEWPGEDYEGSSCRGAIKGWFHHGVCAETFWPYMNKKGQPKFVPPSAGWDTDAAQRPVGAYYRVTVDAIADIQAAIREVGAVYVASDVHGGWDMDGTDEMPIPTIAWTPRTKPDGGHAFALVGYDADGFIVQNSWGEEWGYHGFARMLYDDWLTNADDAWVAVIGAPITARSPSLILSNTRTIASSSPRLAVGLVNGANAAQTEVPIRAEAWDPKTAVQHALILGNDGRPEQVTIDDENASAALDRVCFDFPKTWLDGRKKGDRRVVIYAHGGLNSLSAGFTRTELMGPWFEKNGIYPIFVVWQSGYLESIVNILSDLIGSVFGQARERKTRSLAEIVSDARDRLLEAAAVPVARPVWSQMKQNAIAASADKGGGMAQLAQNLGKLAKEFPDLKIHLVGHSAGAVVLGSFLSQMKSKKISAETVSLYAPACTVRFALDTYLPAARAKIINAKKVAVRVLSDKVELADTVGPYGKSLLYLVSRSLETAHKTPILGMEAIWNKAYDPLFTSDDTGLLDEDIVEWRRDWLKIGAAPIVLDEEFVLEERPRSTIKAAHGCFDNWINCVEETMVNILDLNSVTELPVRVTTLKGI